ncbi:hypothetical protein CPJCM30710_33320 [Clostridium polyendosporum]|uniref:Uncharacterized protein n=1 Tax=Clostridium polyendosporum TaxID=69208 RepID=A0A919S2F2_9CLOT|nr:DUF6512 family protein [Clostridium polyendosporum]GIM30666.1 hypothetical protein CPJCM30710_33320 [Clostridium polyendosporum]
MRNKIKVLISELIGIIFIMFVGLALHFIYELSNKNFVVGLFSSVNRSIWESLKLGFFPIVFYSVIENLTIKNYVKNFFTAKAISSIFLNLFIIIMMLVFKTNLDKDILVVDIGIFIIGCILAQLISIKILTLRNHYPVINLLSLLFLFILTLIFFVYTINPPNYWLFQKL